ncbi:MAG: hypothetical protein IPN17_27530 [Deltaproteobacteria bacterium]|nr:hypothetical protein [Deltaproteobacteria bacterium]
MNPISGLLRADPATRKRLLDDLREAGLAEVVFPRPVAVELVDELLGSPSLVAVRAVRGLTMEALVHLCNREPSLPLERVQVVLRWNDPFYLLRDSLPARGLGLPDLAHLEFDDSATLNPMAFPGSVNGLLLHPLAASLRSLTARRTNGQVRYTATEGGWAAEVEVTADPVDPFVRLFSGLATHVRSVRLQTACPLGPTLKRLLADWQSASGGTLTVLPAKPAKKARRK